ncbi:MAG TPA: hypothetical protein VI318_11665 [Baekduia sp.]
MSKFRTPDMLVTPVPRHCRSVGATSTTTPLADAPANFPAVMEPVSAKMSCPATTVSVYPLIDHVLVVASDQVSVRS